MRRLVSQYHIDGIISDNRFGCRHEQAPGVLLTHQINLIVPVFLLEKMAGWFNRQFIRRFDECWAPDVAGSPNLSGRLSHEDKMGGNFKLPPNLRYVGALSRMEFFKTEKKYDAIAVLSGPEPQRTRLEEMLLRQASQLPHRFLVVQGKPERRER